MPTASTLSCFKLLRRRSVICSTNAEVVLALATTATHTFFESSVDLSFATAGKGSERTTAALAARTRSRRMGTSSHRGPKYNPTIPAGARRAAAKSGLSLLPLISGAAHRLRPLLQHFNADLGDAMAVHLHYRKAPSVVIKGIAGNGNLLHAGEHEPGQRLKSLVAGQSELVLALQVENIGRRSEE